LSEQGAILQSCVVAPLKTYTDLWFCQLHDKKKKTDVGNVSARDPRALVENLQPVHISTIDGNKRRCWW